MSEYWWLENEIIHVEDKLRTFNDRVDIKIDSLRNRATSLENGVLERVASVETDFSSRVSRLEDRLASVLLSKSEETEPDESQAITSIKKDLTDLKRSVEALNELRTDLQECRLKNQQLTASSTDTQRRTEELALSFKVLNSLDGLLEERQEAQVSDTADTCQNMTQALADTQLKLEEMNKTMQDLKDRKVTDREVLLSY